MATPQVSDNPLVQQHYAAQIGLTDALASAANGTSRHALPLLVREFQVAAVSLGADYYVDLRDRAGVAGNYRVPVIDPWDTDQISGYIDAAVDEAQRPSDAVQFGQHLALNAGTDEIFAAIENDPHRPRWARVTHGAACSFCLMVAGRGATYRSESSAHFRSHKGCHCDVEPSFTSYEPPAHIRAARTLYAESTGGFTGSNEKQNAFRRALYAERTATR